MRAEGGKGLEYLLRFEVGRLGQVFVADELPAAVDCDVTRVRCNDQLYVLHHHLRCLPFSLSVLVLCTRSLLLYYV